MLGSANKTEPNKNIRKLRSKPCQFEQYISNAFTQWVALFGLDSIECKNLIQSAINQCIPNELNNPKIRDFSTFRTYLNSQCRLIFDQHLWQFHQNKIIRHTIDRQVKLFPLLQGHEQDLAEHIEKEIPLLDPSLLKDLHFWGNKIILGCCLRKKRELECKFGCGDCRFCEHENSTGNSVVHICKNSQSPNKNKLVPPYLWSPRRFELNPPELFEKIYPTWRTQFADLETCPYFIMVRDGRWNEILKMATAAKQHEPISIKELCETVYPMMWSGQLSKLPEEILILLVEEASEFVSNVHQFPERFEIFFQDASDLIRLAKPMFNKDEAKFLQECEKLVKKGFGRDILDLMPHLFSTLSGKSATTLAWEKFCLSINCFLQCSEKFLNLRAAITLHIAIRLKPFPPFVYDWQSQGWKCSNLWQFEQGWHMEDLINHFIAKIKIDDLILFSSKTRDMRQWRLHTTTDILTSIEKNCNNQHQQILDHAKKTSAIFPPIHWQPIFDAWKDQNRWLEIYMHINHLKVELRHKLTEKHGRVTPKFTSDLIAQGICVWALEGKNALQSKAADSNNTLPNGEELIRDLAIDKNSKLHFKWLLLRMLEEIPDIYTRSLGVCIPIRISALVQAIDAQDIYTRLHSFYSALMMRNFMIYAMKYESALIEGLFQSPNYTPKLDVLNESQIQSAMTVAAILHDLGKLLVPAAVLLKPDSLNDEEWWWIHRHPIEGIYLFRCCLRSEEPKLREIFTTDEALQAFLKLTESIIRHHHEDWNGEGYPDHLLTHQIPLAARIMAIIDRYESQISPRVYRPARNPSDVREEMKNLATNKNNCVKDPDATCLYEGETLACFWRYLEREAQETKLDGNAQVAIKKEAGQ